MPRLQEILWRPFFTCIPRTCQAMCRAAMPPLPMIYPKRLSTRKVGPHVLLFQWLLLPEALLRGHLNPLSHGTARFDVLTDAFVLQHLALFPYTSPYAHTDPHISRHIIYAALCVPIPPHAIPPTPPNASNVSTVTRMGDGAPQGRHPRNCRHFWTYLSSSRLRNANSHRDQGGLHRYPRHLA